MDAFVKVYYPALFAVLFGACAALCLYFGILAGKEAYRFVGGSRRAQGLLVAYEAELGTDGDGGTTLWRYPIVEFSDASGVRHRVRSEGATSWKSMPEGSRVRVLYDPANPSTAEIASFWRIWLVPAMLLPGGLINLAIAAYAIMHLVALSRSGGS